MSDTEWVLNGRTDSDVITILNDRAAKGFSVVQVFATWTDQPTDVGGNLPFIGNNPAQLNPPYWNRWRWIADRAAERGLLLLLLYGEPVSSRPPWSCPSLSVCYEYGRQVGNTFKDKTNVIFSVGEDAQASVYTDYWRAIAEGAADGSNGENNFNGSADYSTTTMTFHGFGGPATFHNDVWLDFYGEEVFGNIAGIYDEVSSEYQMTSPVKPATILEANYEGYTYPDVATNDYWVRVQVFHVFFAGGTGYAYGNNQNYQPPATTPLDWLNSAGAQNMQVFSTFMRARAWWALIPDQSILPSPGSGVSRNVAMRAADGNECLIYFPAIVSVTVNTSCITTASGATATWFDPRNGNTQAIGSFSRTNIAFTPPSGWQDAVLILGPGVAPPAATPTMPLGDSGTLGAFSSSDFGDGGYRAPLWSRLTGEGYQVHFVGSVNGPAPVGVDPFHEGHGGYRIDDLSASIDSWLAAASPDVILLIAGANDIIQGYGVTTAMARMNTLLGKIFADRPSAVVLLGSLWFVPTPNFYNYDITQIQDMNSRLPALVASFAAAGHAIELVDMYNLGWVSTDFNSDQIHPTDVGYAKMANAWHDPLAAHLHH